MLPVAGSFLPVLLALFLALVSCGCGARKQPFLPPGMQGVEFPADLQPLAAQLESEGERNWVLNLNELAVAAMRGGHREIAEKALDESILNINAVFGSTPEAVQARSLFFNEDVKLFKGDPYERSMAFLYRGLLYMQRADWQNARACFRSGALQDAFAEESQNRDDWAIFDYMIGVCELQMARPTYAAEAFERSSKNLADFPDRYREAVGKRPAKELQPISIPTPDDNLLVLTLNSTGPRKVRIGEYRQSLAFERGTTSSMLSTVALAEEQPVEAPMIDSVYYQAVTRGGRPFDSIQKRKVVFKQGTEIVGIAGAGAGLVLLASADNEQQALLGLGVLAAGLTVRLFAELVKTKADTRQWTSLPDSIGLLHRQVAAGTHRLTVYTPAGPVASTDILAPPPGRGIAIVLAFASSQPVFLTPPAGIPSP